MNRSDIDLSQFDDDYANSEAQESNYDVIPDGKYQVKVDKVELTKARTSGNAMLKWTLKILGPSCQGRLLWRNNMLVTRENIGWLKRDLSICGLELGKLSDLPNRLDELLDLQLEVTKKTKGEFENIYINRRITIDERATAADDTDDIPF